MCPAPQKPVLLGSLKAPFPWLPESWFSSFDLPFTLLPISPMPAHGRPQKRNQAHQKSRLSLEILGCLWVPLPSEEEGVLPVLCILVLYGGGFSGPHLCSHSQCLRGGRRNLFSPELRRPPRGWHPALLSRTALSQTSPAKRAFLSGFRGRGSGGKLGDPSVLVWGLPQAALPNLPTSVCIVADGGLRLSVMSESTLSCSGQPASSKLQILQSLKASRDSPALQVVSPGCLPRTAPQPTPQPRFHPLLDFRWIAWRQKQPRTDPRHFL